MFVQLRNILVKSGAIASPVVGMTVLLLTTTTTTTTITTTTTTTTTRGVAVAECYKEGCHAKMILV